MVGISLDSGVNLSLPESIELINWSVAHNDAATCREVIDKLEIQEYHECADTVKSLVGKLLPEKNKRRMSKKERKESKQASRYYKEPMSAQLIVHPSYKETQVRERLPNIDIIKRRELLDVVINSSQVETKQKDKEIFPSAPVPIQDDIEHVPNRMKRRMSQEARWWDGDVFREEMEA